MTLWGKSSIINGSSKEWKANHNNGNNSEDHSVTIDLGKIDLEYPIYIKIGFVSTWNSYAGEGKDTTFFRVRCWNKSSESVLLNPNDYPNINYTGGYAGINYKSPIPINLTFNGKSAGEIKQNQVTIDGDNVFTGIITLNDSIFQGQNTINFSFVTLGGDDQTGDRDYWLRLRFDGEYSQEYMDKKAIELLSGDRCRKVC